MTSNSSPLRHKGALSATSFFLASVVVYAATAAERHHDAHQHGVSEMNLAIEGSRVEIELESPGSDIVGFEHAPSTAADRQAISDAVKKLKNGSGLFAFSTAADCKLEKSEVEAPYAEDHEDKHDHGHKHGHGHDKVEKKGETHSEFHAHYHFACAKPRELKHVDVKLFDVFPRAEEIEVQAITSNQQFKRELTRGSSRLTF
jgi:hypothetical protein